MEINKLYKWHVFYHSFVNANNYNNNYHAISYACIVHVILAVLNTTMDYFFKMKNVALIIALLILCVFTFVKFLRYETLDSFTWKKLSYEQLSFHIVLS